MQMTQIHPAHREPSQFRTTSKLLSCARFSGNFSDNLPNDNYQGPHPLVLMRNGLLAALVSLPFLPYLPTIIEVKPGETSQIVSQLTGKVRQINTPGYHVLCLEQPQKPNGNNKQ